MKQKMSTADVAGEVACLRQRITGMRLANIYDINQKTYLLKVARSGEDGEKVLVVLEAGVRFHATQYARDKSDLPAPFCMKLRKHLRGKRVTEVAQLGVDRIVDFTFGSGDAAHHLLLEIYAAGNVVLADASYKVLAAQRTYKDDARGWAVSPGLLYPVSMIRLYEPIDAEALRTALAAAEAKFTLKNLLGKQLPYGPMLAEHCILKAGLSPTRHPAAVPLSDDEVSALAGQLQELDAWLDRCKDEPPAGFILLKPAAAVVVGGGGAAAAAEAAEGAEGVEAGNRKEAAAEGPRCPPGMMYDDFDPLRLQQKMDKPMLEFASFDAALDEFYSKIESQRQVQQQAAAEAQARSRVAKVQTDLEQRTAALERQAAAAGEAGRLIEAHADAVDVAILAVNGQLATGMAWTELERLLEEEKSRGALIAGMIESLNLAESRATLLLRDADDGSSSDDGSDDEDGATAAREDEAGADEAGSDGENAPDTAPARRGTRGGGGGGGAGVNGGGGSVKGGGAARVRRPRAHRVVVDLTENAFGNAKQYYEERRSAREKLEKTARAGSKAVRAAAVRTEAALSAASTTAKIQLLRKTHWFEKFLWFVTVEGYLVLSGRDAQQNEILVRRYLKQGDAYVHADVHGAASTIVKNHLPHREISPVSLAQAGAAAICRSKAWDSKVVTSAWWVYAAQVSKTAPTGESLTTGSFMIRGRKNYLPPTQLVMGVTFLFRLDEGSLARHRGERAVAGADADAAGTGARDDGADAPVVIGAGATGAGGLTPGVPGDGGGAGAGGDVEETCREVVGGDAEAEGSSEGGDGDAAASEAGDGGEAKGRTDGGLAPEAADAAGEGGGGEDGGHEGGEELVDGDEDEEEDLLAAFLDGTVGQTSTRDLLTRFDRYGLDELGQEAAHAGDGGPGGRASGGGSGSGEASRPRRLSKHERAALKKGLTLEEFRAQQQEEETRRLSAAPAAEDPAADAAAAAAAAAAALQAERGSAAPPPAAKRGQKGKLKKRQGKYADQDAEDAAILAAALGAQGQAKSRGERRAERKAKKDAKKQAGIDALPYNTGVDAGTVTDTIARAKQRLAPGDPASAAIAPVATTIITTATPGGKPPEPVEDVEIAEDEDEEAGGGGGAATAAARLASDLAEVEALTALPQAEDELLYAVPMCAPYDSLSRCKFRVKLVPGSQRKGKASKQLLDLLVRSGEATAREQALLKAVTDNEMVTMMVGNVKLSMPGLNKTLNKGKKAKKK